MFINNGFGQSSSEEEDDECRGSAAILAALNDDLSLDIMRLLLEKNPENLNTRDFRGNTPLLLASGYMHQVKVNAAGEKTYPVRTLSRSPNIEKMALLLEFGADPSTCLDDIEDSEYDPDLTDDGWMETRDLIKAREEQRARGMTKREMLVRWFAKAAEGDYGEINPAADKSRKAAE